MSHAIAARPARALLGLVIVLTLVAGGGLYGMTPAHAGWNNQVGWCIESHNYADPATDYLFASTTGNQHLPEPCIMVEVDILLGGCAGTVFSSSTGTHYASTSTTIPSQYWINPCSRHDSPPWEWHWLPFVY